MHALSPFLRYFEEVAVQGSVRRAAERLHIAPSAVTRQLKGFEDMLGVALFERLPRGVRLTEAGELMLASVRRLQHEFDSSLVQLDALKGLRWGRVRMGVLQYLSDRFIPSFVAETNRAHPGISFTVHIANSDQIAGLVEAGELDIGLCWTPPPTALIHRVRTVPVAIGAVVPAGHALARRRSIRFHECARHPLILPTAEMELRRMLDGLHNGMSGRVTPLLETNSIFAMRQLVLDRTGVAIMTRMSVLDEIRRGELIHVPLSDPHARSMQLSLLVRAGRALPMAPAALLDRLEARFDEYAGI
ncbi:HTH-type transcriptional regulator CynR [Pigmentiphaga humi]|uniref:HTH-type transcriptional regulator CynR n=1 Tax=Pigmentiphaga humi TaxID=2478468 RepID=A0A3P4B4H6_9BURK|nr:LysR family transcriptional regulator [Pigmentiphaga humi]VCU70831.1 HTH-type transcriptional regulator CynR [Pigmentiphaga humi]